MSDNKIPMKTKLSYGCGDLFAGGSFLLVALMYLYFLTNVAGIDPAIAGLIIMIGKIWDAITDPLMGTLSDRTKSRWGRRRVYFLAGIIPVLISFSLLWFTFPGMGQLQKILFHLFSYMLFSTVFTLVQVPYVALMPEISDSYKERASVAGIRLIFSSLSAILAGVVPMMIIKLFKEEVATGYRVMGMVFAVFYAIPWLIVFLGTKENSLGDTDFDKRKNHFKEVISLFRNKAFRDHAGLFISSQTAVDFLSALFLYYIASVLGQKGSYSSIMAALLIVPVIMIPIYIRVARKYKKTTPMHIGLPIWALAMVATLFIGPENWKLIYLISALSGIGTAASVFVPWTILPEVCDVDELISAKRREGLYGGVATFMRKVAGGVAISILGFLMSLIGYKSGVEFQSAETIASLRVLVALVPTVLILTALYFSFRYNVTEEKHGIITGEKKRLKEGGSKDDVGEIASAVCEELTGIPYDTLWVE